MLRILARILLVFALLLGQQAALLHALSHVPGSTAAGAPNPEQPPLPHDCEQCSGYSQLLAVGNFTAALPAVVFVDAAVQRVADAIHEQPTQHFYSARAPPLFL